MGVRDLLAGDNPVYVLGQGFAYLDSQNVDLRMRKRMPNKECTTPAAKVQHRSRAAVCEPRAPFRLLAKGRVLVVHKPVLMGRQIGL
jgi:hypothetical protein